MRKLFLSTLAAILILTGSVSAQLIGTKNIPGDYATLDLAITDLNLQGVGAGGVTLNVLAGNPEIAPAGGYVITATGTAANTISIVGNANVITASPALVAGALNDAIFKIIGGDYIAINGFVMQENPANTTATPTASNNMTEWGVALLYASPTDGAQFNAIAGNTISLNRSYTNTWGVYSNVRHSATAVSTTADITATSGSNSFNAVYGNIISNVNMGIAFIGCSASAFHDQGNDIGGTAAITGNTISNWGGAAAASSYISNTGTSYCIFMNHQVGDNVSYNTLTSAAVSGSAVTFRGILKDYTGTSAVGTFTSTISNNTITMTSGFTSGTFEHIRSQGLTSLSTATININNNTILNSSLTGASATGAMICIVNSSAPGTLNMNNNIIRGCTSTSTGAFTGVSNTGSVVNAISISNNQVGNASGDAITYSVAASGTFLGINNSGAANTSSVTISGNDIRGVVYSSTSSSTNNYIVSTGAPLNNTISNNTYTNLSVNTTGTCNFISHSYSMPANGTTTISGNSIVTAYNRAGASGSVVISTTNGSSPNSATGNYLNNNFSNITVAGSTTIMGFNNTDGSGSSPTKTITGNIFNSWTSGTGAITGMNFSYWNGTSTLSTNTLTNFAGQAAITGISINSSFNGATLTVSDNILNNFVSSGTGGNITGINCSNTSPSITISTNTLNTFSSTGTSLVQGIAITGATNTNVSRNKIYDLSSGNAAGAVTGITVSGGTTVTVSNNLIGDLRASIVSAANPLNGINISGGTTVNVYYNTIHLNATSSGTDFGSSGINASTTPTVNLRNNLVVNLSTPNGTGLTVAYRRSGTTLTNYASASNNNSFYAGTPSATNVIFYDGTNADQTLAAYQARVSPRDASSLSENPAFMSLSGASANFLHIAAATTTLLESGGGVIATFTIDYDNDARPGPVGSVNGGAIAPDIGADEFDGVLLLCTGTPTAGTVSGSPLSLCGSGTFTLSATGASSGPGITYQWQESAVAGGPYTNIPGATTIPYTTASISSTMYYVLVITCTNSAQSVTSTEITATVFPNPVVAVTPTTGSICTVGGTPITLTASGAATYTWLPTAGLTPSTGSPVSANPLSSTTYTVTGTDANGCTATATATITVVETPSMGAVTATPASVCNNGSSQLLATAGNTSAYTQTTVPFIPINSGTGTVVLCDATVAITTLTAGSLDDGRWNGITMPFNFSYFGSTFNTVHVQTNGAVSFAPLTTNTGYNVTMPNTAQPNNLIAACFGDLDWRYGGTISCYTSGVAPNRVFVINYDGSTTAGGGFYNGTNPPTAIVVMQIQLFETSNIIEIHSTNIAGPTTVNHAQGIENADGTTGVIVTGRNNTATWTAANEGIQFAPSGGTPTFAWTPPTFLNNTAIANPMATNITATTTYTVVASENGCSSAPGTVTITAGSLLSSISSASPSNTVCSGTDVTLNVTATGGGLPYTYSWNGPSFTSTAQNPVITGATTAATGTYTIVVTDNCGTTSTTSVTLTVNPLPTVAVTPTTALYCNPGAPIALAATGAVTYAWGPAAGLSATTGASVDASPAATTVYTVTGTDGNGCVSTATTTITSAPAVNNAVATATPAAICVGSTTTLAATADAVPVIILTENFNTGAPTWTRTNASTGGTPANAAWTDQADGFVYAAGTPYHSNDNSQFVQTNSDAQGSGSTARTTLQSPAFSTMGASNLAVDFYHYYRDIGDNGDSAIVESSLDGINWTIVTIYTATAGSEAAFAHEIVPLPSALDNQPTVYVRFRFKATWDWYWSIDNVTVAGLGQNFTYSWTSTPVGFTSTAQNPTDAPAANTTYTVMISHAGGCSATASTSVTVNPLPTVALSGTNTFCAGGSSLLTGTSGGTSQWYLDGAPIVGATTNTYLATAAGVYNMTKTNTNGCSDSAAVGITVVVNPLPTVVANATATTICDGDAVTLTGSGASTYTWAAAISVTDNVAFNPTATDTYTVTGTDGNGCQNTDMITVTVNPLPTVVANATATAVCDGSPVTLSGSGAATYTWTGSVTDNVAFTPLTTDTYTVTGTDANGCVNTDMITVTVNPLPVVALTGNTVFCAGDSTQLSGTPNTMNQWYMNGSPVTGATTGSYYATAAGVYNMTEMDVNGCMDSAAVGITVIENALPAVTASASTSAVCAGSPVTFTGGGAVTYTWTGGVVDATPFTITVTDTYTVTGTDANGCMDTASVMVTANPLPTVTAAIPQASVCVDDGNLTLTGGSPAGGTWSGTNVSGTTFDPTTVGSVTITYTYTDGNGCTNTATDNISVDACTGIPTVGTVVDVTIYPNPNEGQFTIQLPAVPTSSVQVEVMNELGQVVDAFTMTATTKEVNISTLESGVYFVRVINEGKVSVHRVVKQ